MNRREVLCGIALTGATIVMAGEAAGDPSPSAKTGESQTAPAIRLVPVSRELHPQDALQVQRTARAREVIEESLKNKGARPVVVAAYQMWNHCGGEAGKRRNLERMITAIEQGGKLGVQLMAFPEMCLPGYFTPVSGSLDFPTRPARPSGPVNMGSPGSRARCFRACSGSLTARGSGASGDGRRVGCGLPLPPTASALRSKFLSRLDTRPARTPVNALPMPSRTPAHDLGPLWAANPSTYDSFIHYTLPVYPGAQGDGVINDARQNVQYRLRNDASATKPSYSELACGGRMV